MVQENTLTQIDLKEDKAELEAAEKIAQRLGLETIGCIFTHAPREELLTADEVIDLAKYETDRPSPYSPLAVARRETLYLSGPFLA